MASLEINMGNKILFPLFISPDSQRLYAISFVGEKKKLKVWNLRAAGSSEVIEDRDLSIKDAAVLVRERSTESAGGDSEQNMVILLDGGLVKLLDLATYKPVDVNFLRVGENADRLVCSPDGNRMAIGYTSTSSPGRSSPSRNAQVAVFDLRTRTKVQELNGAKRWNSCEQISFSPDSKHIIAISDNWLAVWDDKGNLVKEDDTEGPWGGSGLPSDMAVTPDSTKIIWTHNTGGDTTASSSYCVLLHDLTGHAGVVWEFPGTTALYALDISGDGRRVIAGGRIRNHEQLIFEWSLDASGGNIIDHESFDIIGEVQGCINFARITPDLTRIVVVYELTGNKIISVWDYPKYHII